MSERNEMGNGMPWAAMAPESARTPGEEARAEYAYRVQSGQLDPNSPEGRRAFEEAERLAAMENGSQTPKL